MPRWKYSSNGSYSGGNAFINGTDQPAADANFRTFGYQTDNPPSPGGTTEEEDLSASANPSSNASLSPSPGGAASVIENIIRNNKTFLDFGENLWRNYWAIVSLGAAFLAVIGLIIWYLVVRRNKTQFGDSKRGRRPPSEEKSARSYGENDDSNNKQG
jgi:hypothetical protein